MDNVYQQSVDLHQQHQGKLGVASRVSVTNRTELSQVYTPGVAEVSRVIAKDVTKSFELTLRGRTVAVISDGSAVLGLGNIGPEAAMPVMEGKALLMKEFAGIDAFPLVINSQQPGDIVQFVKQVAPTFAGINLEDISAPRCFQIEDELQEIGIPVFHDDQHGTAIVVTAALTNAAKVVNKPFEELKVVVVGAGAAGLAITKMLLGLECSQFGCRIQDGARSVKDVIVVDSKGAIYPERQDLNVYKQAIASVTNKVHQTGSLADALTGADVVIGVSGPETIAPEMISQMADKAIVFAMANPVPEIMPEVAVKAGAMVVATGRSDFANQINNVLAFPGIFKAVVDLRLPKITHDMKQAAAQALAALITQPSVDSIIPEPFDKRVVPAIVEAIRKVSIDS